MKFSEKYSLSVHLVRIGDPALDPDPASDLVPIRSNPDPQHGLDRYRTVPLLELVERYHIGLVRAISEHLP